MNQSKRLLFQSIFWLSLWLIFSFLKENGLKTLLEFSPLLVIQLCLIIGVIYFIVPNFLFKKKHLVFFGFSLFAIVLAVGITSIFLRFTQEPPHLVLEKLGPNQRPPFIINSFTNGLIFLITYLLALFLEGILYWQKREKELLVVKSEALQSELKLLKSQINPHFLFNALNNIYALTVIDSDKTRQSINYLSDMLRYVLYDCENPFVFPQKEVKYIENYIRLFTLKSSKKYPIKMAVQIEDNGVKMAPMLLIPFVENALKHGRIEKIKDSFVDIKLVVNREGINFEIENSIPTITFNKDEVGGIGLENIKRRLNILYPDCHELSITASTDKFKVKLNIKPLTDA